MANKDLNDDSRNQLALKKGSHQMKLLTLLMIVMSLFVSGCGDSDLESMVYEKYKGQIYDYDLKLSRDIIKITSRQGKVKDIWEVSIYYKGRYGATMVKVQEYSFRLSHSDHVDSITEATPNSTTQVTKRMRLGRELRFIRELYTGEAR